jgi:hypothetical protein
MLADRIVSSGAAMKIAPKPSLLAAAVYLEAFHFIDMQYMPRVQADDVEGIYKFLQVYEVMRFGLKNLPDELPESERKRRILEPLIKALHEAKDFSPEEKVVAVYKATSPRHNQESQYNRSVLSGISKWVWMLHPGKVPITDRLARGGLRKLTQRDFQDDAYAKFVEIWQCEFRRHHDEIEAAWFWAQNCDYRRRIAHYVRDPVLPRGIDRGDVFRNRIFDLALHVVDGRFDKELLNYCSRYFSVQDAIAMECLQSANALVP